MEPPKLIVSLTVLIRGRFPGKWSHAKIFTNLRLCDVAVVTSCGCRWELADTDMGATRMTEVGGGGRIKQKRQGFVSFTQC